MFYISVLEYVLPSIAVISDIPVVDIISVIRDINRVDSITKHRGYLEQYPKMKRIGNRERGDLPYQKLTVTNIRCIYI